MSQTMNLHQEPDTLSLDRAQWAGRIMSAFVVIAMVADGTIQLFAPAQIASMLHETGFALLPTATARDDGQVLTGLYITAAVRCAPPDCWSASNPLPPAAPPLRPCAPASDARRGSCPRC